MSRETKTYTGTRTQWTIERNAALEKTGDTVLFIWAQYSEIKQSYRRA